MNLPKAFDSIPDDFLIAKIHVCDFSVDAVILLYLYLNRCKRKVRINNTHSVFQIYYLEFLKVQHLGQLYSTYLLIYIPGYQKQTY